MSRTKEETLSLWLREFEHLLDQIGQISDKDKPQKEHKEINPVIEEEFPKLEHWHD